MNPYFKKILRFAKPYKKYAYLNIFFNILYALFGTMSFVALIPVLKVIFKADEAPTTIVQKPIFTGILDIKDYLEDSLNYYIADYIDEYGNFKVLMITVSAIIILFLLKNLTNYLAMYFITFLRNGILQDIRNAMYEKLIKFPLSFYSEKTKGDTIARVTSDVQEVRNSVLSILEMIVREPLNIIFSLALMIAFSVKLTIFVFLFLPISGYLISVVGKSLKKGSLRVQNEQGIFLSVLEETMGGLRIIKAFNAEGIFKTKFEESTERYTYYSNKVLNRQNVASPLSELLGIITIGILLLYGGYLVFIDNSMDPAFFLGYILLAYNILTPAKAISKASYSLKRGDGAAQRILEFLETDNILTNAPNAIDKQGFESNITINNISFKYKEDSNYVLKNFNLTVPKGKTVALVGQSGSGKSTIANLVTRFYDVNEGTITIDGVDIKDMSLYSLRNLFGMVSQKSILFNDSIENNLRIGKIDATETEIANATQVANAYDFIQEKGGLDFNIGDSGNNLSGGQQQRLSIARAVLKNPPIMILDEATSSLDTESERLVQDALEKMMQNRTSIVIAHRLSTIQNADLIVVMQKGEIIEQGSHKELMALNGHYKKLVEMQSFD
ncbi:antibiotic ABC transporter ATP-binding protein [Neptunitalea chrysea]|uniref:Antibiotic ABC transporter ATP-binding protein n=1 Tax=Neptunitalea chrysea TaxID=1647581 RepID=A0A9W6ETN8_9FLAO|nr:ABC transporter ATP-binding protein [Neptunitalea chrysea]GLB52295.1 antibiotic ABC transporter ATP-binding protein [Neptunitalea chrysea]